VTEPCDRLECRTAAVRSGGPELAHRLGRRGTTWRNTFTELAAIAAANTGVALVTAAIIGQGPGRTSLGTSLFLIGVLTLIVLIYDRSYAVFLERHRQDAEPGGPVRARR
jgi:hypothetical protein